MKRFVIISLGKIVARFAKLSDAIKALEEFKDTYESPTIQSSYTL